MMNMKKVTSLNLGFIGNKKRVVESKPSFPKAILQHMSQRDGESILKKTTRFSLGVTLLMMLLPSVIHAAISVNVNRNPITINDTIQITVTSDQSISGEPNLDALKTFFHLHNISQHSGFSLNNGATSRSISRVITATPKQEGNITLPAITWDNQKSQPITLKVLPAKKIQGTGLQEFFVEAEFDIPSPYVQEQVLLTLKAYSSKQFSNGQFSTPEFEGDVKVTNISDQDDVYRSTLQGIPYQVQERRFLLFPERSGTITMNPVIFQGTFTVARNNRSRDPFAGFGFGFNQGENRRVQTPPQTLTVKPIPDTAKRPWLPSSLAALDMKVSDGEYRAGEPITLTMTTTAKGVLSETLPEIRLELPKEIKAYPDQPTKQSQWRNGGLIAQRVDKVALIPTDAGTYTIPPITLHWWNTEKDTQETLQTQAITLNVLDEAGETATAPSPKTDDTSSTNAPASSSGPVSSPASSTFWMIVSAVLFILWLITLGLLIRTKKSAKPNNLVQPLSNQTPYTQSQLLSDLENANPNNAISFVLKWAQKNLSPEITNITKLAEISSSELASALQALERCVYTNSNEAWDSEALITAFKQQPPSLKMTGENTSDNLPPLYPK